MDEQLKRRLMGVTIIVALSVIFVPMLIEDKSDDAAGNGTVETPALPEAIEQHSIELPKSASDVVTEEKTEGKDDKKGPDTSYHIVPLDDAPPKPPKVEPPPPVPQATTPTEGTEVPVEEEGADEGEVAPTKPPEIKGAAPTPKDGHKQGLAPKAKEPPAKKTKPGTEPPHPERAPKKSANNAKSPEELAPDAAPDFAGEESPPPKKVEKPKPTPVVTPKPTPATPKITPAGTNPKPAPTASPVKRSEAVPPAKTAPAPAKPISPKPTETDAATPAPVAPKPQEPKQAAPEAAAPKSWSVQAGSFTGETNARGLAEKLRKAGLSANVQVSQGQSGPVYKVTVGAGASKAQAEQVQKQIESASGIKGIMIPHR